MSLEEGLFIEQIENFPCLWDLKHPDHKDKVVLENAFKTIAVVSEMSGERPYSCTECQHHFTNWPNYNKHMKRRHGINTSVNCRTKQEIPPTGKPNRNPPGTVLAAPQPPPPVQVVCQTTAAPLETYNEATASAFYPVLGLYGIQEDIPKGVL